MLLADLSKFGQVGGLEIVSRSPIHMVISDSGVPAEYREYWSEHDIEVETVSVEYQYGDGNMVPDSQIDETVEEVSRSVKNQ